jgi:Tol biopolymer transport system component
MNVDGSDIKRLTTKPANRCSLSWSSSNMQLVYQEGCDPTDLSQVYLVTLLDNGVSKVVQIARDGRGPSWSSDGRWLHWESVGNLQHIGSVDASGDIVSRFDLGKILAASDVVWSPNSKQMAQAVDVGGEARIQVWDINGDGAQEHDQDILTSGVSLRDRLKWLRDGKRFVFSGYGLDSSGRMANKESWFMMNIDGTHLVEFEFP